MSMTLTSHALVRVSLSKHSPDSSLAAHEHTEPYISFVLRGEYEETVGRRTIACDTHCVRFHPGGEVHANLFGRRGGVCLNLGLGVEWQRSLASMQLIDPADLVVTADCAWPALQIAREMQTNDETSALAIEELTTRILDDCAVTRRRERALADHPALSRAVEFIHGHLAEAFTLYDVACAAQLHRTHLARVFKRAMGETIGGYTRRARLVRAQDLMRFHPRWPLSRLAIEAGFTDHAHFTRVHSRIWGAAPSTYRMLVGEV